MHVSPSRSTALPGAVCPAAGTGPA